jgi:Tfp pilus assembly pilus retraction ATPase PilT
MDITELLAFSAKNGASDLHLSAGMPPMIRVDGEVRRINLPALEHKEVHCSLSCERIQPKPRCRCSIPYHSV